MLSSVLLPAQDYTSNLVAFYPFNGNANDASGNGNNGTLYNATLTVNRFGFPGKAYAFNGSSTRIEVPDHQSLRPANMTASAWVYYDAVPTDIRAIFGKPFLNHWQNSYTIYYGSSVPNALSADGSNSIDLRRVDFQ